MDGKTINLGQFFQTTTSPRGWLGTNSFYGNFYTPGTLIDPSLSGIFPGQTHTNLSSLVLDNNRLNTYTPWNVTTLAGQAGISRSKDGNGFGAQFAEPSGIAVAANGAIYVADNSSYTIRRLATNGVVTTIAGRPWIWGTINALGTNALFQSPSGLALDSAGNLYVADSPVIRKIDIAGNVTTYAGQQTVWGSQNGSRTNGASFGWIQGLATDSSGNLYVADTGNQLIRKIASNGIVTTIAGQFGVTGAKDGQGTNALFNWPYGITVGTNGVLLVADTFNNSIRRIAANGTVTTVAGQSGTSGRKDTLSGVVAATNTLFNNPMGIASDIDGNILVSDFGNHLIRRIGTNGIVSTIAGNYFISGFEDRSGQFALFNYPHGVAMDRGGSLIIADYGNNTIRKASTNVAPIVSAPYLSTQETVNVGVGLPFKPLQPGVYGSPTSYGASGLPPGLAINASTGIISGTPTTPGIYSNVIVTASNGAGSASTIFTINVGLTPPPPASSTIVPTPAAAMRFARRSLGMLSWQGGRVVAGGGNYLVYSEWAQGPDTKAWVSADGIQGEEVTLLSGSASQVHGIAYGGGVWLGVLTGSGTTFVKSTNGGSTWSQITDASLTGSIVDYNSNGGTKLVYAEGRWVLSGQVYESTYSSDGYRTHIWTSDDAGVTWTDRWSGSGTGYSPSEISSIGYGNGILLAVGPNGLVITSSDKGVNWVSHSSGTTQTLRAVAYGNGRFVAVGDAGTVLTSTDNGATWVSQISGLSSTISGIAYGDDVFVLGEGSYYGSGWSSKDGVAWTPVARDSWPYFQSVAYGASGFVGVHYGALYQSVRSGVPQWDWQTITNEITSVGNSFTKTIKATGATSFIALGLPPGVTISGRGVVSGTPTQPGTYTVTVYASNSSGTSDYQSFNITIAYAGATPAPAMRFARRSLGMLSWQGGRVVAGGGNYLVYSEWAQGPDTKAWVSADGIQGEEVTLLSGSASQVHGIAYGGGVWLGVLTGSGTTFVKSTNGGSTWSQITDASLTGSIVDYNSNGGTKLVYAEGRWVLSGQVYESTYSSDGYRTHIWTSDDAGVTWTDRWSGSGTGYSPSEISSIGYGNGILLAVGPNGLVITSSDKGVNWVSHSSGTTQTLRAVAYGNGRFVAVGDAGTVLTSTDNGATWVSQISGLSSTISGIAYGDDVFVLGEGSYYGSGWSSKDGVAWTPVARDSWPYFQSVAYGASGFVGVHYGALYQSVRSGVPQWDWQTITNEITSVGNSFTKTIKATGATSFIALGLPPGVTMNPVASMSSTALMSGTPTQAGTYTVTVYASNASGTSDYQSFNITVAYAGANSNQSASAPWIVTVPTNVTAMLPLGSFGTNVTYPGAQIIGAVSTNYSMPSGSFFNIGTNLVTVTATGANGQTASTNFPVIVTTQPAWKAAVAGGKQYSQIVLAKVLDTNGVPITAAGSLLAVFRGEDVVACADPKTTNSMTTYGLNVGSDQASANGLTYNFFNAQTGEISTLAESLNFRSNETRGTPLNPIVLNVPSKTTIALKRGWNWVSFNVLPVDGTIESLLKDYSPSENEVIKGTDGLTTYSGGTWYPSPANFKIQSGKMYMLSTKAEGELQISGLPASTKTLTLKSGWNWIGSPLRNAVAVDEALNKINPGENDTILAQPGNPKGGFATFSESNWYLYADEFLIEPGKGYLLYITTPQSITF